MTIPHKPKMDNGHCRVRLACLKYQLQYGNKITSSFWNEDTSADIKGRQRRGRYNKRRGGLQTSMGRILEGTKITGDL
jgi:hypothetical protein